MGGKYRRVSLKLLIAIQKLEGVSFAVVQVYCGLREGEGGEGSTRSAFLSVSILFSHFMGRRWEVPFLGRGREVSSVIALEVSHAEGGLSIRFRLLVILIL